MDRIELVTQPSSEKLTEEQVKQNTLHKLQHLVQETKEDEKGKEGEKQTKSPSPEVDADGFEIPPGKIPLDGNFSTSEVKEMIELAQEGGILDSDLDVKVVEKSALGNKVVVSEKEEEDERKKKQHDGETEEKDENQGNGEIEEEKEE
ncbi:hypothetical protein ACI3LY_004411 [Candidozyma auris]|nr:hypothetical_protein [[Candida] auris]KNE01507.2 hypothetical protein QG37_01333 [[Candida] auris]PIS48454.1 hypothetical protein B9J08_005147 [[Candida] auris]PIS49067.1 hypothetical protein CJI97_005231 [[Candida] auris]PSK79860.1 hypothetical protein CJJ07_000222 [[Candida] auris]QEL62041.1 hypothetical protein CJJ09_004206 [[Candida] auris]